MPAFVMNNVCASKLVRKCFIQQKQVPPMHIYLANIWKLVLPPAVSISFFFRRFLFNVINYTIHDSWVQTIHCFTIQTGVMFKVLELGEKSIQDYKIIFYSPYKMSWQSVSVEGVPKLNTNHCIIEF